MDNKELLQAMKEMIAAELKDVREDMKDLKEDMKDVKARVTGIEITIENKIEKNIRLIAEGHQSLAERLGNLPDEVEKIRESTDFLDFMQKQMIEKLRNK